LRKKELTVFGDRKGGVPMELKILPDSQVLPEIQVFKKELITAMEARYDMQNRNDSWLNLCAPMIIACFSHPCYNGFTWAGNEAAANNFKVIALRNAVEACLNPQDDFDLLPFWIRNRSLDLEMLFGDELPVGYFNFENFLQPQKVPPAPPPPGSQAPRVFSSSNDLFLRSIAPAAIVPRAAAQLTDIAAARRAMKTAATTELSSFLDRGVAVLTDFNYNVFDPKVSLFISFCIMYFVIYIY
jgi:hypothetical protein